MNLTAIVDALGASPAGTSSLASVLLLLVGGWVLVSSSQRRRD